MELTAWVERTRSERGGVAFVVVVRAGVQSQIICASAANTNTTLILRERGLRYVHLW